MFWLPILDVVTKLFKFLKEAKEIFVVYYNNGKINKGASFWRIAIFTGLILAIVNLYFKYSEYEQGKRDRRIENKMGKFVVDCGLNSYMSWIVLEGRKYHIKNIIGCVNDKRNCLDDRIKFENSIYLEQNDQTLDENTFWLAQNTQEGATPTYNDVEKLQMYDSLYKFLSKTNYPIEEIGFTVVKDFKKDTIYIFLVSFIKGAARTCQNPWIDLQNFGFEVKRIL